MDLTIIYALEVTYNYSICMVETLCRVCYCAFLPNGEIKIEDGGSFSTAEIGKCKLDLGLLFC